MTVTAQVADRTYTPVEIETAVQDVLDSIVHGSASLGEPDFDHPEPNVLSPLDVAGLVLEELDLLSLTPKEQRFRRRSKLRHRMRQQKR